MAIQYSNGNLCYLEVWKYLKCVAYSILQLVLKKFLHTFPNFISEINFL